MDELDPYTVGDNYDPNIPHQPKDNSDIYNYSYEPGDNDPVTTGPETETSLLITAETRDPNRQYEVDLSEDSFSVSDTNSAHQVTCGPTPLIPFSQDSKRVSIHPLGIAEKPPGVAESVWEPMNIDRLSPPVYDASVVEEIKLQYTESDEQKEAPQTPVSGGSGGRSDPPEEEHDRTEMPFLDHLEEFRWALLKSIFAIVIGMTASWFLAETFIITLTRLAKEAEIQLAYLKIMGPVMIRLQTALFMGLIIALPFVFYFLWAFVSPGLYKREKRWILPVVISATVCFFIGSSIAYFLIIPIMLKFIVGFMVANVEGKFDISNFISWMLKFTALFGVIFELPLLTFILAKIGILKHSWMSRYRKYAIVLIFVAGAILTPPDPLSQIMMAVPLILLYEISILVARIAGRKTLL